MRQLFSFIFLFYAVALCAQTYKVENNISYITATEKDAYRKERCKLDIYYPSDKKDFSTVVWFHGGGLESGSKNFPEQLMNQGFAVVAVNYRLSPRAKNPSYIIDAAEAVAWVMKHIADYGGRTDRIFVSGHSAGGYLTLMLALDKQYLSRFGADADKITAYLPISGQTVTHFTIRKERGLPDGIPVVDEYAPLNKARRNTSPIILLTGDKSLEMASRYEENALLESVLRNLGNKNVKLYEMQGFDHGQVCAPACVFVANYLNHYSKH
ncbi:MAG: alpha/beta hydrolase [Bacteroidales bacterium]|nr:alpha/beta hydrolase [Bacteroidales bacterium]